MPMKPTDKIYWLRVILGLIGGSLASYAGFTGPGPNAFNGVYVAIAFYLISYYLSRFGLGVTLEGSEKRKFLITGLGSFIMLFLFSWILSNTLITLA